MRERSKVPLLRMVLRSPKRHLQHFPWLLPPRFHHSLVGPLVPLDVVHYLMPDHLDPVIPGGPALPCSRGASAFRAIFRSFMAVNAGRAKAYSVSPHHTCQTITASFRAVATAAAAAPRLFWIRTKAARSGPGAVLADQAASTSILRASPPAPSKPRPKAGA